MKARHFVRTRLALAVLTVTVPGCQLFPSGNEAPAVSAAAPVAKPAQGSASTTETMGSHSESAAQPMALGDVSAAPERAAQSPAVAEPPALRRLPQPAPARTKHAAPPTVEWLDPNDLRLSPAPLRDSAHVAVATPAPAPSAAAPAAAIPAASPDSQTTPKFAAIEEADSSANTPLVVPEGYEIGTAVPPSTTAPAPATSAAAPSTAPATMSSEPLDQKLAQRLGDNPRDVAAHLEYQLLQFLRDEPVPQASAIAALPAEDREVLTAVLDGLSNFRNAVRAEANMLLSRKVQPILAMAERVRSQADLTLPTIMLCTKVDGFGIYDPIEPARFIAGREHPAIIYCEVANFASRLNDNKRWETRLRQEAVLYTEGGLSVWQDKGRTITDLSRNRRHDFFIVKLVRLPANLTIGRYFLKVTVIDQQANRVAEATAPIQIVAE